MKRLFLLFAMICFVATARSQNITAAEYFLDADPGSGNGTPITISTPGDIVNFTANVPTGSLSAGFHFLGIRTKDATGKWGLYETRGFYISNAANNMSAITAAEYFFDTDPGRGNGTPISIGSSGDVVNFAVSIPTGLAAGFHFLAIRTRDANGVWGLFETRGFFITSAASNAADIVAAEFFFDADPGAGNATPVSIGASGAVVNFAVSVPTSLAAGFHFVAIRVKGSDGVWGLFETRGFYISGSTTDAANITAAEYFFDSDPGVGNGTPASIGSSGATVNFSVNIPTTLPAGFHFLAIRTKGTDGVWGHYEKRGFYISSAAVDAANIVAAEYFFDADPGVGNGTPASIGSSGAIVNFTAVIPTSLATGFHFLSMRVRDAAGNWGLFETRGFYISQSTADMTIITAAEYFFDADPGIGNGTPLTITAPGNIVNQTFVIPAGALPLGQHFLSIRVRDQAGFWSLYDYDTLNIGNSTITCPANQTLSTAVGACSAIVSSIDPVVTPVQSFTYTLSGATTGTGSGTASGQVFNPGTTTVLYALTGSPTVNCSFTVTVNITPIQITTQPATQAVCTGNDVTFTVAATGTGLSFQWRKGGVNITGATGTSFTITGAATGDAGNYDVVISNSCSNVTSNTAVLTVNTTPAITSQPVNTTACVNGSASFSVTAVGSGLTFQWRKGGVNISGATSSSFTINPVSAGDAGSYDVVINSACGTAITSTSVSLTINTPAAITIQPVSQVVCVGNSVTFSVAATGSGISFQWRKGGVNIGGATSSSFTIASPVTGDAGNYEVVVSGTCPPIVTSNTVTLTVNTPPSISVQPTNQTVCAGAAINLSVAASGSGLSFQWRKGGVNIPGATSAAFTLSSAVSGDAGSYDVVVTGTCPPALTSSSVTVIVNAVTVINTQPLTQTVCVGSNVTLSVAAVGTALTYQWRKGGVNITGANSSTFSIPSATTGDAGNYDVIVSGTCGVLTSSVAVLTVNAGATITTQPVSQTVCAASNVTFTVNATGSGLSFQWRKGGVNISGATSSSFAITGVTTGDAGSYDVVITSSCGTLTSTAATLTVNAATAINTQPLSTAVCAGGTASFSVTATGTAINFQWRKGGVNITGATSSTFSIAGVTTGDAGNYDVVVSGTCGSVTSSTAILTVNATTAITTQPTSQTVCAGSSASFTVVATGVGLTFQWRKGGVNIGGATSAIFTIAAVSAADAGSYDVVVSGTCGTVTSAMASLAINPVTVITTQPVNRTVCAGSPVSFTVVATGTALTYQWRKGGVNIPGATASTFNIGSAVVGDAGNYDVVVSGTCGNVTSSVASLIVSAAGTWIGVTSADWSTASNWCGGVPGATTDVIIPSAAANMPVLSGAGSARNITINTGGSVAIAATGVLDLFGNISGSGTFNATPGSIAFRGATSQTVPGFTANNVTLNGAGGVLPTGAVVINGTLTLTNGNLTIGANNLTLANSSTGSLASHVITNGAGTVILRSLASGSTRTVPIGSNVASFNPVIISANAGHATDDINIRVTNGVFVNGSSGTLFTEKVVDRTWLINESVSGGSNVNISLQWTGSQELPRFERAKSYVSQFLSGAWTNPAAMAATGTDPFVQSIQNVTTLSAFSVQTQPLPRPIKGIYPNPVLTVLNIVTELQQTQQAVVSIYDATGRLVYQQAVTIGSGVNQTTLDLTHLAGGVYFLKITGTTVSKILSTRFVRA